MRHSVKKRIFVTVVYIILAVAIGWQSFIFYRSHQSNHQIATEHSYRIFLQGNIRKPGLYVVPEGTTDFEILKVAGIRPTSDISNFILANQISRDDSLNVGTLEKPVSTEAPLTGRLEFYIGEVSVISKDGESSPQHEGLMISDGDRVITEASAQAEISIGAYSRIDMDNFSEVSFDKLGAVENNRNSIELFQKSGACWYKAVFDKEGQTSWKVTTNNVTLTVGGKGADFFVDVLPDQIQISLMDGLLLVERSDGNEALNMISGQSITVYNDKRPFQVSHLTPDLNINDRFSKLSREKFSYMARQMPLSFLLCGAPAVFYLINLQFETGTAQVVHIPPELIIDQFSQGLETLNQAYLYGGPVFVSTFIERILDIKVPKYCVFERDDIMKISSAMGGINAIVDTKAASYLKINSGVQKLSGTQLVHYLSPSISGIEDGNKRQGDLIRSIFQAFQSKNITMSMILADQIITNTQTNFMAAEMMEQYTKFNSRSNWTYKELNLPVNPVRRGERVCFEPLLEQCRVLLNKYE